jgi:hypothetical protein
LREYAKVQGLEYDVDGRDEGVDGFQVRVRVRVDLLGTGYRARTRIRIMIRISSIAKSRDELSMR